MLILSPFLAISILSGCSGGGFSYSSEIDDNDFWKNVTHLTMLNFATTRISLSPATSIKLQTMPSRRKLTPSWKDMQPVPKSPTARLQTAIPSTSTISAPLTGSNLRAEARRAKAVRSLLALQALLTIF